MLGHCGTTHLCFFMLSFLEKSRPHLSHLNGLSPVWIRMCRLRRLLAENILLQVGHMKYRTPDPATKTADFKFVVHDLFY